MMNERNFDELQFMMAMEVCPAQAHDFRKAYGVAMAALEVYERVTTVPEKAHAASSKLGVVEQKANQLVGIVCSMQNKTGRKIIKKYMKTPEEKVSFLMDLDDFFNEMYASVAE